jgi:hypothetical protein
MAVSLNVFRDHTHPVVHNLKKPAPHKEPTGTIPATDYQASFSQQRHERGMVRQDADLTIEGGRDDRVRLAVEHSGFWRDDRDLHHPLASFLDFSTASSMPPTM